jgi:hypothetical protein
MLPIVEGRSCKDCTVCCDGTLKANIRGHEMNFGKPCFFVQKGKGCSDYENRPRVCREFQCEWLTNPEIPEELAPNKINALISRHTQDGIEHLALTEAGVKLDSEALTWVLMYALSKGLNLKWSCAGNAFYIGQPNFVEQMDEMIRVGYESLNQPSSSNRQDS